MSRTAASEVTSPTPVCRSNNSAPNSEASAVTTYRPATIPTSATNSSARAGRRRRHHRQPPTERVVDPSSYSARNEERPVLEVDNPHHEAEHHRDEHEPRPGRTATRLRDPLTKNAAAPAR
jgi:hypothetical protein